jgi:hypothetical protein
MPTVAYVASTLLYLLPVAVFVACRARRARPLWAVALDVPLAVACDLLLVLTMARVVTLELATLASRVVWLAGGAIYFAAQRRAADPPAWPRALGARALGAAIGAGAVGAAISMACSRPYSIWDRKFHTPVVSALRGQTIPFENALAKGQVLHYHFSGDVQAAMVQSLSLDTIHSSLALSVGHDILFTLTGITLAFLLVGLGGSRARVAVVATLVTLLAGPYTIGRSPAQPHTDGYSILNFLSLSFRPHDALAGLFFLGIAGALAARVYRETARVHDTAPALLGITAGLALSDETSLGMIGLALGVTWLAYPRILHPHRVGGAAILVGMLVAFLGPNVAFAASLAPGAQHHAVAIVPWRSPGCYTPTLPLGSLEGAGALLADLGPTAFLWLGGVLGAISAQRRRSGYLMALASTLFLLSAVALTRIEVNHDAVESHRFMTGEIFLAPVFSMLMLLPHATPLGGGRPRASVGNGRLRDVAVGLWAIGATAASASTIDWIGWVLPRRGHRQDHFFTKDDLYALDCKRDLGATIGARATPAYLSKSIWYAYAGCHPTFAPAKHENAQWVVTIGNPYFDKEAVRVLRKNALSPEEPLGVICQRKPSPSTDPVCVFATHHGACEDLGERLTRCELTAAQVAGLAK